ncbi:uncharacterized protein NPIL_190741 [Nephila pilipes]|uniref:Uncharacterized protein n=1 Tax=Nephila pilipes TaxID=299642 RepID=A0A8X6U5N3_NEPPI|nr:uncharacterized protein NPIL_190741 [Nephila pilipes]
MCAPRSIREHSQKHIGAGLVFSGLETGCPRMRLRLDSGECGRPSVRPSHESGGSRLRRNNQFVCTRGLLRDPVTRTHVRLLDPCFKTGRVGHRPTAPQHRRPPKGKKQKRRGRGPPATPRERAHGYPRTHRHRQKYKLGGDVSEATVRCRPGRKRSEYPKKSESTYEYPPSRPTKTNGVRRPLEGDECTRAEPHPGRGRRPHVRGAPSLASAEADDTGPERPRHWTSRAYPFPSEQFHVLLNSLFKVLFNFPSRYLFAIGLTVVFSLGWSLPPVLGLHSQATRLAGEPRGNHGARERASHPLRKMPRSWRLPAHSRSTLPTRPNGTFPCSRQGFGAGLLPVRSPLLGESLLFSFPPLNNMLKFSGEQPDEPESGPAGERLPRTRDTRGCSRGSGEFLSQLSRRVRTRRCQFTLRVWASYDPQTGEASSPGRPEAAMRVRKFGVQCVLQFTPIIAASCVLHRPVSRVIHCSELS